MKGKALLFGLNYAHCKQGRLNGCINDVRQVANQIYTLFDEQMPVEVYTDDLDRKSTSYDGIFQKLYDLAISSYKDNLDFVWIHYSGHGSHQKDINGDELDGEDEGLVPSDYETKGLLLDDVINRIIACINPKTKVLFISDCCHSGSILDLHYSWDESNQCAIENSKCTVKAPTILISGCRDSQTSADAFNLLQDNKHIGALTASIIKVLQKNRKYIYDAFMFVDAIRKELKKGRFEQYPCLSSTYDLIKDPSLIPLPKPVEKPEIKLPQYPQAPKLYQQQRSQPIDSRPPYTESQNTYIVSYPVQQAYIHPQYPQYPLQITAPQPIIITYIPIIDVHGFGYCV